jgi:hypothetical protein
MTDLEWHKGPSCEEFRYKIFNKTGITVARKSLVYWLQKVVMPEYDRLEEWEVAECMRRYERGQYTITEADATRR